MLDVLGRMDQGGERGPDLIVVVRYVTAHDIGPDHRAQRHLFEYTQNGYHIAGCGVSALTGFEINGKVAAPSRVARER